VLAIPVAGILSGACVLPEDVSPDVSVMVAAPSNILSVGDTVQLDAVVLSGETPIAEAQVAFISSDSNVAFVTDRGILRAVGVGGADIVATAVGFESAASATLAFTVTRGVRIDTVLTELELENGHTVRWGERATIVGSGLNPAESVVFLGDVAVEVVTYVAGDSTDATAVDTLHVIIPALVPGGDVNLIAARLTGAGAGAQWPLAVVPLDVFEPNEDAATGLGAITAPVRRTNLALEVVGGAFSPRDCASVWTNDRGECWSDWYAFNQPDAPASDSVTLVFKFPRVLENTPVSIEVRWPGDGPESALLSRNFSLCSDDRGSGFAFWVTTHEFAALRDSFVVALAGLRGQGLSFSATLWAVDQSPEVPWPGAPTGTLAYELRVLPGYAATRPADIAEDNDFCQSAYELTAAADTLLLNFDNGTDLDWFHFTVPEPAAGAVARSPQAYVNESEPNNTPATADTIQVGDRAFAAFDEPSDIDYFTFYSDSGVTLDIETTTVESFDFSMNTVVFLLNDDGIVAWNDDFSANNYDSRVVAVAPKSGWYTLYVIEKFLRGGPEYTYSLTLSPAAGQGLFLSAEVCCSTAFGEFDPQIQLWQDELLTEGGIIPLEERDGRVEVPILPGDYFLLVYNRGADPVDYELRYRFGAGSASVPIAPVSALPDLVEEVRNTPRREVRRR
jgi:hypothetical protein